MKENSSLLELDVHFCGFKHEDEDAIYQAILRNRCQISYLDFIKNAKMSSIADFLF